LEKAIERVDRVRGMIRWSLSSVWQVTTFQHPFFRLFSTYSSSCSFPPFLTFSPLFLVYIFTILKISLNTVYDYHFSFLSVASRQWQLREMGTAQMAMILAGQAWQPDGKVLFHSFQWCLLAFWLCFVCCIIPMFHFLFDQRPFKAIGSSVLGLCRLWKLFISWPIVCMCDLFLCITLWGLNI
jgi:hypothetical protein